MRHGASPRLLVAIGGNAKEWQDTLVAAPERPRLPLPYALGGAAIIAGFKVSAIDLARRDKSPARIGAAPFEAIYSAHDLKAAVANTDVALLWGWHGVQATLWHAWQRRARRPVLCSYVWSAHGPVSPRRRVQLALVRTVARTAKAVVVMTSEQATAARASLPRRVPVIQLRVGIDTAFYGQRTEWQTLPEHERAMLDNVGVKPFVVLPGDELRMNDDALAVVENSDFNLVRIAQYRQKSRSEEFRAEVKRRGLQKRVFIFERISYPALRLLMQRATVYAGLVDATWQPAGWTVACECLASGLPIVLYDGLTSRELRQMGAGDRIMRSVPMRDIRAFIGALDEMARHRHGASSAARDFARRELDLEMTGDAFAARLAELVGAA